MFGFLVDQGHRCLHVTLQEEFQVPRFLCQPVPFGGFGIDDEHLRQIVGIVVHGPVLVEMVAQLHVETLVIDPLPEELDQQPLAG